MLRLVRVRYLLEHMEVQKVLQHFARQLGEKLVMFMSPPVCCHNVAYLNETDARPGISILVCANNRLSWISCMACPMVIMLHPFWGVCIGDYRFPNVAGRSKAFLFSGAEAEPCKGKLIA